MSGKSPNVQRSVRFPSQYLARLEAIAQKLGRPGFEATSTDAIRYALDLGIAAAEQELGIKPTAPKKGAK